MNADTFRTIVVVISIFILLVAVASACAAPANVNPMLLDGVPVVTIEFRQMVDRNDNVRAYRIEDTEKGIICYMPASMYSGQPAIACVKE